MREKTYVAGPFAPFRDVFGPPPIATLTSHVLRPISTVSTVAQYVFMMSRTSPLKCSQSMPPSAAAMKPSRLHAAP